jgi:sulfide:quinone oxidoreductase
MSADEQSPINVAILGGGVAALEAALALRDMAGDRVALTIVAAGDEFVLRPLLVGEPFGKGRAPRVPLNRFAADVAAELVKARVERVDPEARELVTDERARVRYDRLVVAIGARPVPVFPRAYAFAAEEDPNALSGLLRDLEEHYSHRAAFVVPPGVAWSVPIYELALMTAVDLRAMGISDAELHLVTPEERPLDLFGAAAADDVARLLERNGIVLHTHARAEQTADGTLVLQPSGERLERVRVVALPRLEGPYLEGLPADSEGFIPVDRHCRVIGVDGAFCAGDAATWPIKQGGLATQQADVAAQVIAREAGADVEVHQFSPVLRGMLLTGSEDHYLRSGSGAGQASDHIMWWPPSKVAGRYLAPYLAGEIDQTLIDVPDHTGKIPVEVDLQEHLSKPFG